MPMATTPAGIKARIYWYLAIAGDKYGSNLDNSMRRKGVLAGCFVCSVFVWGVGC